MVRRICELRDGERFGFTAHRTARREASKQLRDDHLRKADQVNNRYTKSSAFATPNMIMGPIRASGVQIT